MGVGQRKYNGGHLTGYAASLAASQVKMRVGRWLWGMPAVGLSGREDRKGCSFGTEFNLERGGVMITKVCIQKRGDHFRVRFWNKWLFFKWQSTLRRHGWEGPVDILFDSEEEAKKAALKFFIDEAIRKAGWINTKCVGGELPQRRF